MMVDAPALEGCGSETRRRLEVFVALLRKWNLSINLVAKASLDDVWSRHVLDSLQILDFRRPGDRHWLDIGSGAGLPGMVVAIAAAEQAPDLRFTLIEADQRKAEFLRNVSRETNLAATVLAERIEAVPTQSADIVSARALAPLPQLCAHAERHLAPGGQAIFLKGARVDAEIASARENWDFRLDRRPSLTDPDASILLLTDLRRA